MEWVREEWVSFLAISMLSVGLATALALSLADENSELRKSWRKYVAFLEYEVRFLHYQTTGQTIAIFQTVIIIVLLLATYLLEDVVFLFPIPLVAIAPSVVLQRRHAQRVATIDEQLDVWLVALSNALKAAPSLGEAISSSARLTRPPLQEELDLAMKEVQLGSPLDQALTETANRVGSRTLWGAVATLLVARQTGGDVPGILEESAESLREMARLDGLVQAKTAEGKTQAYVLSGIPFVLLFAIHMIDNTWLRPLTETTLGFLVIGGASLLWTFGFLSARKILAVDV